MKKVIRRCVNIVITKRFDFEQFTLYGDIITGSGCSNTLSQKLANICLRRVFK